MSMSDDCFEGMVSELEALGLPVKAKWLRARDTAQREALARVEAELAEAVGLLRYSQEIERLFDDEHTAEVGRFLARHAQAEQQEAQGAQAGDDYFASPEEYAEQRAALATQPAVPAEVERLSSENAELKDSVERLEATVQDERQLRAKVGRIAQYLNEFASGRSTFSRIQEINDAIQGVPNGN